MNMNEVLLGVTTIGVVRQIKTVVKCDPVESRATLYSMLEWEPGGRQSRSRKKKDMDTRNV